MSYKLIPRFYYSYSFARTIGSLFTSFMRPKNIKDNKNSFSNNIFYTNYARTGLRVLLSSISKEKLRIGVQAYTCHTVFQAIHNAGHGIVFIDIDNSFKLDIEDLKIKKELIDVLIITHTFGFPENYELIRQAIGEKVIIEDCAHSFLSFYHGKQTGSLADASIFSFGLGKPLPIGQGGAVYINDKKKFPHFNALYGSLKKESFLNEFSHFFKRVFYSVALIIPFYGLFTYKIGKKLDSKYDFINKHSYKESRGYIIENHFYINNFDFIKNVIDRYRTNFVYLYNWLNKDIIVNAKEDIDSIPNFYILPLLTDSQDIVYRYLLRNDFEPGKHFHKSILWAKEYGYEEGCCKNTEKIISEIITIPAHPGLPRKRIKSLANLINNLATIHKLTITVPLSISTQNIGTTH